MKVVVAADKFRGTLTAIEACEAIERGVAAARPDARIELVPLADGGEGTMEILLRASGGTSVEVEVSGPLGERVSAPIASLAEGSLLIEMAACSGLVVASRLAPLEASSRGVGEAILKAASGGAAKVTVGIGGSASTDGGTGAARALGWRFLDASGRELPEGGGELHRLRTIDDTRVAPGAPIVVGLCDVKVPLIGSAMLFGPQKGAFGDQVARLDEGLARLAEVTRSDLGVEVADLEGAGAGGGMAAGLVAFFGATLRSGPEEVAARAGLAAHLEGADLVITGEGTFDGVSLDDKVPAVVARMARAAGVPCALVAGRVTVAPQRALSAGFDPVVSLSESVGERRSLAEPEGALADATERLVRSL